MNKSWEMPKDLINMIIEGLPGAEVLPWEYEHESFIAQHGNS